MGNKNEENYIYLSFGLIGKILLTNSQETGKMKKDISPKQNKNLVHIVTL